jgi:hypothetical protein
VSHHGLDEGGYEFKFQPVVPFRAWGRVEGRHDFRLARRDADGQGREKATRHGAGRNAKGSDHMDMTSLLIQLIGGALGGNVVGSMMKQASLGTVGNSMVGILGGGIGGRILGMLMGDAGAVSAGGPDLGALVSSIASGGVGGGALMAIIGLVRSAMSK